MLTDAAPVEDDRIVAKCYVELGNVTKEKGEYDESLRYHRRSMAIYERIDDPLSVADSHLNIAEVYKAKGELKRAMSEYEKGLTLYEDVYVEDSNNSNDVSLNSSSFSDLQHTKALSKSDETLPQTARKEHIDESIPPASPRISSEVLTNGSTSSMDPLHPSTQIFTKAENTSRIAINTDYSPRIASEHVANKLVRSLSASSLTSDRQFINDTDGLLPLSPTDLVHDRTSDTTPEENDFIELCSPLLPPVEATDQELLTTNPLLLETKPDDNNVKNLSTERRKSDEVSISGSVECLRPRDIEREETGKGNSL